MTAPFAFLGPDYDDELRAIYTSSSSKDLAWMRSLLALLTADSVADTAPLRERIAEYFDAELLEAVAVEWRKGRQLRVATTDLDISRPVMPLIRPLVSLLNPGLSAGSETSLRPCDPRSSCPCS